MRVLFLLCGLVLGCGRPVEGALQTGDASVEGVDAGVTADAGAVTFELQLRPLFMAKCSGCHEGDGGLPAFSSSYAPLLQPSTLCPGERVGDCVKWVLQVQRPEGDGCRTFVQPFHREGWVCLTPDEIDLVVGWVNAGLAER